MPESIFRFKQFSIHQDQCAMKVGTDAVLLGAWVNAKNTQHILDIGTGTGVIAIMLAQKCDAAIDAIDIDENSSQQAIENVSRCPWPNKVAVFHTSLQYYAAHTLKKYDLIVSNPPFFADAPKSSETARNLARHTDHSLSFDELIDKVEQLLTTDGRLCLVLPFKEGNLFVEKAYKKGLYCNHFTSIRTKDDKPIKRLLMEFERTEKPLKADELVIQDNEMRYTNAYIELTKDYYLGLKEFRNFL